MEYTYLMNGKSLAINEDRCTGCGICGDVCPHEVFALLPGRAEIRNRDWCMECGACALNCPLEAITVNKGVGCAGAIIGSMFNGGITSCDCGCSVEPAARDKKKKRNAACC